MAKNFGNAGSSKIFDKVVAANDEKVNADFIKMIADENIFDCEFNDEDVSDTEDLESSICELGFTDPIEVTDFGMEPGAYMIVSGHRRRVAGVNCGIKKFPCIVKRFTSESQIKNYLLLSNNQRDTAKDPLLFCRRYKKHEEYLSEINFSGSIREEIARRMGISVQQADRYKQFNNVIKEAWELVKNDNVGMSSLLLMASHSEREQREILDKMRELLDDGITLTRTRCESLITVYREEKRKEIFQNNENISQNRAETSQKGSEIFEQTHKNNTGANKNTSFSESAFCDNSQGAEIKNPKDNSKKQEEKQEDIFENPQNNFEKSVCSSEKLEAISNNPYELFIGKITSALRGLLDNNYLSDDKKSAEKILSDIEKLSKTLADFTKEVSKKFDL